VVVAVGRRDRGDQDAHRLRVHGATPPHAGLTHSCHGDRLTWRLL
jgi:hypothetical protein